MSCQYGLLNDDAARLEKSGVFAAYAAHGVVPICIGSLSRPPPGLEEDRHFVRWPLKGTVDVDAIQRNVQAWYYQHAISKHADALVSECRKFEENKQAARLTSNGV